jgi:hypothetical protein
MSTSSNKPAYTIRGSQGHGLKLTLWENQSEKGGIWFNATLTRSYKDQAGQWQETHSLSQQDFLEAAEMYREAHAWAKEQARAKAAGQTQDVDQSYTEHETARKQAGGRQR